MNNAFFNFKRLDVCGAMLIRARLRCVIFMLTRLIGKRQLGRK